MTVEDKQDSSQLNPIQSVREQIVNAVLLIGSLIGIISIGLSFYLSLITGWQYENVILLLVVLYIITLTILRKRIPYHIKSITSLACIYLVGIFNLTGWGLISSASVWFITTVLLSVIFYNARTGIFAYIVIAITLALSGLAVHMHWLEFDVDFTAYSIEDLAWLSRILIILLVSALVVVSVERILTNFRQQLEESRRQTEELARHSEALSLEMQKRAEAERALAEAIDELKDLDYLKDAFIDNVSHELRTPIANIQLYHQLLGMKPEKSKDYLKTLKTETRRLSYIVEQMLYASGDESDLELSTMVDIDLYQLASGLLKQYQGEIRDKQIKLSLPDTTESYLVPASSDHIDRVLLNMVDNAVKYTPHSGEIKIAMFRDDSNPIVLVGLCIQNTGDCPLEKDRERLFERFVRGESALKMAVPGAGLGLSICRQVASKYGGRVDLDCDSEAGVLSFTLWLPSELQLDDTSIPLQ